MKIHTRTRLIIGGTVFALIVVLAIVAQFFILSSYAQIEQQESATNVALVTDTIQSESGDLSESLHNTAVSDTTYNFTQEGNPEYIHAFIDPPSFHESLGIDGILFYNSSGDLVYSRSFTGSESAVRELADYFTSHPGVLMQPGQNGQKRKQGFVLLPDGPVIVAIHAISPENGSVPENSDGRLVAIRVFGSGEVSGLAEEVHLPVQFFRLDDPSVSESPVITELSRPGAPSVVSSILNQTTMIGSTLVSGMDGAPVLLLDVQTPRNMNTQATGSMVFILGAFLVIGIIYVVVSELLLRRYILTHLTGLDTKMKEIGDKRDLSARITVSGDDEISSLKKSLNEMLKELEEKEEELAEAHRKANLYLDIYLDVVTYEILNATIAHRAYAELILESEGEYKKALVSRVIALINRNRDVIKNIETISAIYKHPPSKIPVNLEALIKKVVADFPGLAIQCEGCGLSVLADEKLEIVFRNVLNNSIKYGGDGVNVVISAKVSDGMAEISVTDTGQGIPDNMKPKIFDRFRKGSDERSSYGLGLHIVKMLIEAYGGWVWADDRVPGDPKQGAAIRFTLFLA